MNLPSDPPNAIAAITLSRSQSLTTIVYEELERRILRGELKGGDRFNEQSMANSLGVSRGPVREARRSLEKAGLVVSIPGQGTFVRKIEQAELAENYDIRALLTGFAAARIAKSGTSKQRTALKKLVKQMYEAIDAENDSEYYALNLTFHDTLMDNAQHHCAGRIYQDLIKESHLGRQMSLALPPKMRESNDEHQAIVDAIIADDAEAARLAGERHVLTGKRRWMEALSKIPVENDASPRSKSNSKK